VGAQSGGGQGQGTQGASEGLDHVQLSFLGGMA
jgi:hypothetical protein